MTFEQIATASPHHRRGVPVDGYTLSMRAGYLLRRSHRLQGQIWASHATSGITSTQYAVLAVIEGLPGIDQTTLGAHTFLDRASVAGVVGRLVTRGEVLRRSSPFDSRRKVLALSRQGKQGMSALHHAAAQVWIEMLSPIDDLSKAGFVSHLQSLVGDPADRMDAGTLFRRLEQKRFATWADVIGEEVTGAQYAVIHVVGQWPGVSQTELGELAALDKSTVAGIVDRLVAKGWVDRQLDAGDARVRRLYLTQTAVGMVVDLTPRFNEVQQRLLSPLPPSEHSGFLNQWAQLAYHGDVPVTAR